VCCGVRQQAKKQRKADAAAAAAAAVAAAQSGMQTIVPAVKGTSRRGRAIKENTTKGTPRPAAN
jgi:hypothetical protein